MPNLKQNSAMGNAPYIASFTSVLAGGPTVTTSGRTYAAGSIVTVDRFISDFAVLKSSGWIVIADHTGTTAQRPSDSEHGYALPDGFHYLDTTLGKVVIRIGNKWLDINTGSVA